MRVLNVTCRNNILFIMNSSTENHSFPSVCIPRMPSSVTRQQIYKTFETFRFGSIERIDIIPVYAGKNNSYQRVFVHFKSWNFHSLEVSKIRDKLISGENIKMIYDGPYIWKVSLNRASFVAH